MERYNEVTITKHAYIRMKERNGWNKKTADRMVSKIYSDGKRPHEIKGYLKNWINGKVDSDENGNEFVLYGQELYIFNGSAMITVFHVPSRGFVFAE